MDGQAKIVIRGLRVWYQKKEAIQGLDLSIPAHSITALFGPAGSGITTLLRSLNRLFDLTPGVRVEGEILLDGKNIYHPDTDISALRRRLGMVFDVPAPLPMSIFENVVYGLRLTGMKRKSDLTQAAEEALVMAALWDDVKDRLSLSASSLSGGQQQRLCIARVLALKPEVILLDRPCSGLDPISTAKIEDSLFRLKEHLTVIIAPHTVQQAGRISDKAVFMLMGRLVEEGPTRDIFTNPKDQRTSDYLSGRFG